MRNICNLTGKIIVYGGYTILILAFLIFMISSFISYVIKIGWIGCWEYILGFILGLVMILIFIVVATFFNILFSSLINWKHYPKNVGFKTVFCIETKEIIGKHN